MWNKVLYTDAIPFMPTKESSFISPLPNFYYNPICSSNYFHFSTVNAMASCTPSLLILNQNTDLETCSLLNPLAQVSNTTGWFIRYGKPEPGNQHPPLRKEQCPGWWSASGDKIPARREDSIQKKITDLGGNPKKGSDNLHMLLLKAATM